MDAHDVEFRYVGIKVDNGEIPSICLCYDSKESAIKAFEHFHEYLMSSGGSKMFIVDFNQKNDELYHLTIFVTANGNKSETSIEGIDPLHVQNIKTLLVEKYKYYVLMAGYYDNDKEFCLLPLKDYHVFRSNITIDGKYISGNSTCSFDWLSLIKD